MKHILIDIKWLIWGIIAVAILGFLAGMAWGESYIFLEQKKGINSSYEYRLPKIEINQQKYAGKFFGNKCFYLSEVSFGLVYTAPREAAWRLNHHSVEADWDFGVEVGAFWVTYSLGGRWYIEGNSDFIPAGFSANNRARVGMRF